MFHKFLLYKGPKKLYNLITNFLFEKSVKIHFFKSQSRRVINQTNELIR